MKSMGKKSVKVDTPKPAAGKAWAWWDAERGYFRHVYSHRRLVEMCFPNGARVETKAGRGKITRVIVSPLKKKSVKADMPKPANCEARVEWDAERKCAHWKICFPNGARLDLNVSCSSPASVLLEEAYGLLERYLDALDFCGKGPSAATLSRFLAKVDKHRSEQVEEQPESGL